MRRALIPLLLLVGVASADDEDPKAAIADRGIVLKVNKRNFLVIVPNPGSATPKGSTLHLAAKIYFGDAKSLREVSGRSGQAGTDQEDRSIYDDPRFIYTGSVQRNGDTYELVCGTTFRADDPVQRIKLTPAAAKNVSKAVIKELPTIRLGVFLARLPGTTTYLYLDRRGPEETSELRLLIGKRGALKPVAIKELASDASSLVAVTAKGVLTLKRDPQGKVISATWGPANKPADIDAMSVFQNRKLIYQELGIYTREPSGYPCDEL